MKSQPYFFVTFFFLLFLQQNLLANLFFADSVEYSQPNGISFLGREFGDEYLFIRETLDEYRFVKGIDGWYYYAVLDAEGKYTASSYKVSIDQPLADSYQLEPSAAYLEQVEDARAAFAAQVREAGLEFQQRQAEAIANNRAVEYSIGIILAEFKDVKHFKSDTLPPLYNYREYGYLIEDFERMFFSRKEDPDSLNWYKPNPNPPSDPSPHPEQDRVYGSLLRLPFLFHKFTCTFLIFKFI